MNVIVYDPNKEIDVDGKANIYGDHMYILKDIDNPFSKDFCGNESHYFNLPRAYDVMVKLLRNGDLYSYISDENIYINTDTNEIDDMVLEDITEKSLDEFDNSGMDFVLIN